VPEGTTIPDRTMVAHDCWDLLADDAPFEPLKVQLVALLARRASGGGVISGAATGEAAAQAAKAISRVEVRDTIMTRDYKTRGVFQCHLESLGHLLYIQVSIQL
jgi:hypothetical protein